MNIKKILIPTFTMILAPIVLTGCSNNLNSQNIIYEQLDNINGFHSYTIKYQLENEILTITFRSEFDYKEMLYILNNNNFIYIKKAFYNTNRIISIWKNN